MIVDATNCNRIEIMFGPSHLKGWPRVAMRDDK